MAALVCLAALTTAIVCAGSGLALYFRWIEHLQVMAVAGASAIVLLAFWIAFTLMFGRIYCSVICPIGIVMDIAARAVRSGRKPLVKKPYHYIPPANQLRYLWLCVVAATFVFGCVSLATLTDPATAYSTIVSNAKAAATGHTLVVGTLSGVAVAVATMAVVGLASALTGRSLCNVFCPLGSVLSIASRHSYYGIDINTDKCVGCNRCVDACKSHCINPQDHTVDSSRCVVCFDCLDACRNSAIAYTGARHRLSTPLMARATGSPQTLETPSDETVS